MNHISDILSASGHVAPLPPKEHTQSTQHSSEASSISPSPVREEQSNQPPTSSSESTSSYALDFDAPSASSAISTEEVSLPSTTTGIPVSANNPLDVSKMKSMIFSMKDQLNAMLRLLDGELVMVAKSGTHEKTQVLETGEKVIEGVFNGLAMVGEDGREYTVPVNYASKSKMVEGDLLKLTITNKGSHIYKQIGPIERKRMIGELVRDAQSQDKWMVLAEGKTYKVLGAAVTYYKGESGDEVVLLVPRSGMSEWGAVDHIIKKQVHGS